MLTKKLLTDEEHYNESIEIASKMLYNGGIVAIPTETVYGLAASAYDDVAIKKVFEAKGRPQDNPLIVHISDMNMLNDVAKNVNEKALLCAEKFWPGPFTMVLEKTDKIANSVSAGLDTVAVRMPSDKIAHDIIKTSGIPLAAPSANISGRPSPTTANHVIFDLDTKVDGIVIGGECTVGVESTVIALFSDTPRLLRPGAVTVEQLKEVLPDIIIDKAVLSQPEKNAKVASPGMKYKHYAPKTETYLVESTNEKFIEFVNEKSNSAAICFSEDSDKINIPKLTYGNSSDESTLAHSVFSALREIDNFNVETVYVHAPSKNGVGLAVYNRLIRAAAFRVIKL